MSEWLRLRARSERQYRNSMPERGFLNTVANGHFRTLDDGKTIFYPQGAYGRRGFVVSSPEQERLLRRKARENRSGLPILYFIMSLAFGGFFRRLEFWQHMTWVAGLVAADWAFARIYYWRFTRNMKPSDIPNSPVAFWRSKGLTMSPMLLILQTVLIAGMAAVFLYFPVRLGEPILLLFGVLMLVGLVPFVIALRSWWTSRRVD